MRGTIDDVSGRAGVRACDELLCSRRQERRRLVRWNVDATVHVVTDGEQV